MNIARCGDLCICLKRDRMTHEYIDKDMSNPEFHWKIFKTDDLKYERFMDVNIRKPIWAQWVPQKHMILRRIFLIWWSEHSCLVSFALIFSAPSFPAANRDIIWMTLDGEKDIWIEMRRYSEIIINNSSMLKMKQFSNETVVTVHG